jgi:hypothetical protein
MKYTRLEINNKAINVKHNSLFWFFIIIPLISIIFGGLSVKFLVGPYIKNYTEKTIIPSITVDSESKNTIQKAPINKLYYLQVGVFANKDNAQILKNTIGEKGITSFVVHEKDKYKVVASFSENKNILSNNRDKLNKLGYNSIINSVNFLTNIANAGNNDKIMNKYVSCLSNIFVIQVDTMEKISSKKDFDKTLLYSGIRNLSESFKVLDSQITNKELMLSISQSNNELTSKYAEYNRHLENNNVEELNRIILEEAILLEDFSDILNRQ